MRGKGFLRPPRRGEARNDPARRRSHCVKLSIRTLIVGNPLKPRLHLGDVGTRVVGPLVEAGILPANQALLGIGAGEDKRKITIVRFCLTDAGGRRSGERVVVEPERARTLPLPSPLADCLLRQSKSRKNGVGALRDADRYWPGHSARPRPFPPKYAPSKPAVP
jgi:hypothetical protein